MKNENEWIEKNILELKKLHEICRDKEIALSRYIGCMIRLLNALAQMSYSQFHYYEREVLWKATEIFTQHFIEQIEYAREEKNIFEKRILIDDIENAVEEMTNVFKNVIDGTANTDRQRFSNISVNTNVYELSPKICIFYSKILNKLVKMFDENENEYAFILHPTLKNNTETKIMFEKREKPGKVVIIYISESIIEDFESVCIFLLHEAFHVLTRKERLRKKRIGSFIIILMKCMEQILLKDVVFDKNDEKNNRIKEKVLALFFDDWLDEASEWKEKNYDSRDFYSSYVKMWAVEYCQKRLEYIYMNLEVWVTEEFFENDIIENYEDFKKYREKRKEIIKKINENVLNAINECKVIDLVECFMGIYREIYADIACILTLELNPEEYELAFEQSKQFRAEKYTDSIRYFRNLIVSNAIAENISESGKQRDEWIDYRNRLGSEGAVSLDTRKIWTFKDVNVILKVTPQLEKAILSYASACAEAFNVRINEISDISCFRERIKNIRDKKYKEKLLIKIMTGDLSSII